MGNVEKTLCNLHDAMTMNLSENVRNFLCLKLETKVGVDVLDQTFIMRLKLGWMY